MPILSDLADACNSMEIVLAIEESAVTEKPNEINVKPGSVSQI
jgi:hypothetical protein